MRHRASNAGTNRELKVMDLLASEGWLCASRRHIGGAGDVLATRRWRYETQPGVWIPTVTGCESMLIEVKSTAGGPWERFGPADRQALVDTAERHGADPWLYYWPARGQLRRISGSEFPINQRNAA